MILTFLKYITILLENGGKLQLDNLKSGRGRLRERELFIAKLKSQFIRGFTKAVVTRADSLRELSQEKRRLYILFS